MSRWSRRLRQLRVVCACDRDVLSRRLSASPTATRSFVTSMQQLLLQCLLPLFAKSQEIIDEEEQTKGRGDATARAAVMPYLSTTLVLQYRVLYDLANGMANPQIALCTTWCKFMEVRVHATISADAFNAAIIHT